MKILVTGSSGFIGEHLCSKLTKLGHKVIPMDLKTQQNIHAIFGEEKPDLIFHLAAQTDVQASIKDPWFDAYTNIMGTINLIRAFPKTKIIYTDSAASIDRQSPYGLSKNTAAEYIELLHKNYVICTLPNVFGFGGKGVVSKFIEDDPITVYGDGENTRTFVFVMDIVDALIKAMKWETGRNYYLGTTRTTSVNRLAKATGKKIRHKAALPGEIRDSGIPNTTPNWKPKIDAIKFLKQNANSTR